MSDENTMTEPNPDGAAAVTTTDQGNLEPLLVLQAEHRVLQRRLADLREAHERLENRLHDEHQELIRFKDQVVEVAADYAGRHGWCAVINEALDELGLKLPSKKYQATLAIMVTFTAELTEFGSTPEESDVLDAIRFEPVEEAIKRGFRLNPTHSTSVEISDVSFDEVTDVETVDD